MKQFIDAKIKLTIWYTMILMIVSIFLSGTYYLRTVNMLEGQYRQIEMRFSEKGVPPKSFPKHVPRKLQLLEDDFFIISNYLKKQLFLINGLVFLLGATASYFLAGKTLIPIQESLEKQKRFIADASHELRTPLTALKTSLEVSLLDKKLNLSARKVLQDNLKDINSLTSLTENLLSLARVDDNNFQLSFQKLELKNIIEKAINHITPLAKKKNIDIKVSGLNNQLLQGNENALVEVMMIVLDNAIKYSSPKTIIKVSVEKKGKNLLLKIKDQGIGISKDNLPFIFDRFYRAESSRTKQTKTGYGLGLSVAQKIMNQHSGQILVESKVNRGSIFTLVF
ncbi:MAG: HAMP domain-containing histidine kinase [Candidatus Pacebacteria bacterium]|jgi:two-component system, OmpR family, sensor histidine kinase CiaH|nr:HAMP domain-containing histidine kinase [Candidatus Paceibacterota bacterium]MBT4652178.1 HAMP domain-containing histidine kinase [Candidatus Paceibacterota bacterium]MBT6756609.1 HAMP domain-containing histidine kinase [Candidatus Paceibacterota bacterium]MBT6920859.1 HAMP domain-containing histidine kinase [Candidatus Paceibacterota bacterium]